MYPETTTTRYIPQGIVFSRRPQGNNLPYPSTNQKNYQPTYQTVRNTNIWNKAPNSEYNMATRWPDNLFPYIKNLRSIAHLQRSLDNYTFDLDNREQDFTNLVQEITNTVWGQPPSSTNYGQHLNSFKNDLATNIIQAWQTRIDVYRNTIEEKKITALTQWTNLTANEQHLIHSHFPNWIHKGLAVRRNMSKSNIKQDIGKLLADFPYTKHQPKIPNPERPAHANQQAVKTTLKINAAIQTEYPKHTMDKAIQTSDDVSTQTKSTNKECHSYGNTDMGDTLDDLSVDYGTTIKYWQSALGGTKRTLLDRQEISSTTSSESFGTRRTRKDRQSPNRPDWESTKNEIHAADLDCDWSQDNTSMLMPSPHHIPELNNNDNSVISIISDTSSENSHTSTSDTTQEPSENELTTNENINLATITGTIKNMQAISINIPKGFQIQRHIPKATVIYSLTKISQKENLLTYLLNHIKHVEGPPVVTVTCSKKEYDLTHDTIQTDAIICILTKPSRIRRNIIETVLKTIASCRKDAICEIYADNVTNPKSIRQFAEACINNNIKGAFIVQKETCEPFVKNMKKNPLTTTANTTYGETIHFLEKEDNLQSGK
jgi:hypothetical protein